MAVTDSRALTEFYKANYYPDERGPLLLNNKPTISRMNYITVVHFRFCFKDGELILKTDSSTKASVLNKDIRYDYFNVPIQIIESFNFSYFPKPFGEMVIVDPTGFVSNSILFRLMSSNFTQLVGQFNITMSANDPGITLSKLSSSQDTRLAFSEWKNMCFATVPNINYDEMGRLKVTIKFFPEMIEKSIAMPSGNKTIDYDFIDLENCNSLQETIERRYLIGIYPYLVLTDKKLTEETARQKVFNTYLNKSNLYFPILSESLENIKKNFKKRYENRAKEEKTNIILREYYWGKDLRKNVLSFSVEGDLSNFLGGFVNLNFDGKERGSSKGNINSQYISTFSDIKELTNFFTPLDNVDINTLQNRSTIYGFLGYESDSGMENYNKNTGLKSSLENISDLLSGKKELPSSLVSSLDFEDKSNTVGIIKEETGEIYEISLGKEGEKDKGYLNNYIYFLAYKYLLDKKPKETSDTSLNYYKLYEDLDNTKNDVNELKKKLKDYKKEMIDKKKIGVINFNNIVYTGDLVKNETFVNVTLGDFINTTIPNFYEQIDEDGRKSFENILFTGGEKTNYDEVKKNMFNRADFPLNDILKRNDLFNDIYNIDTRYKTISSYVRFLIDINLSKIPVLKYRGKNGTFDIGDFVRKDFILGDKSIDDILVYGLPDGNDGNKVEEKNDVFNGTKVYKDIITVLTNSPTKDTAITTLKSYLEKRIVNVSKEPGWKPDSSSSNGDNKSNDKIGNTGEYQGYAILWDLLQNFSKVEEAINKYALDTSSLLRLQTPNKLPSSSLVVKLDSDKIGEVGGKLVKKGNSYKVDNSKVNTYKTFIDFLLKRHHDLMMTVNEWLLMRRIFFILGKIEKDCYGDISRIKVADGVKDSVGEAIPSNYYSRTLKYDFFAKRYRYIENLEKIQATKITGIEQFIKKVTKDKKDYNYIIVNNLFALNCEFLLESSNEQSKLTFDVEKGIWKNNGNYKNSFFIRNFVTGKTLNITNLIFNVEKGENDTNYKNFVTFSRNTSAESSDITKLFNNLFREIFRNTPLYVKIEVLGDPIYTTDTCSFGQSRVTLAVSEVEKLNSEYFKKANPFSPKDSEASIQSQRYTFNYILSSIFSGEYTVFDAIHKINGRGWWVTELKLMKNYGEEFYQNQTKFFERQKQILGKTYNVNPHKKVNKNTGETKAIKDYIEKMLYIYNLDNKKLKDIVDTSKIEKQSVKERIENEENILTPIIEEYSFSDIVSKYNDMKDFYNNIVFVWDSDLLITLQKLKYLYDRPKISQRDNESLTDTYLQDYRDFIKEKGNLDSIRYLGFNLFAFLKAFETFSDYSDLIGEAIYILKTIYQFLYIDDWDDKNIDFKYFLVLTSNNKKGQYTNFLKNRFINETILMLLYRLKKEVIDVIEEADDIIEILNKELKDISIKDRIEEIIKDISEYLTEGDGEGKGVRANRDYFNKVLSPINSFFPVSGGKTAYLESLKNLISIKENTVNWMNKIKQTGYNEVLSTAGEELNAGTVKGSIPATGDNFETLFFQSDFKRQIELITKRIIKPLETDIPVIITEHISRPNNNGFNFFVHIGINPALYDNERFFNKLKNMIIVEDSKDNK
jgi:hypothetical protein